MTSRHCKKCRKDKDEIEFFDVKEFKTCNMCRHVRRKPGAVCHRVITIEECKEYALSKNGECLSDKYKNNITKMTWKCEKGHEWKSIFSSVKNCGSWCPTCAGAKKLTIEECKEYALSKNGECLSDEYKNARTKMTWKCEEGHEWKSIFDHIKRGSWCPTCVNKSNKSESMCREIFESLLIAKFRNTRPKFLEGLELDGYNEILNIAFEYNGIQHYKFNKHFHRNDPEAFERQKQRDQKKYELCRKNGINLIIIPYQFDYMRPDLLKDYIQNELKKLL